MQVLNNPQSLHLPGEFILYGGTLDANNPAVESIQHSGNVFLIRGELWVMGGVSIARSAASIGTVRDDRLERLYQAIWGRADVSVLNGKTTPNADWSDTNKALSIPSFAGRSLMAAGSGSGLTTRAIGDKGGSETASLTANNNGPHIHQIRRRQDMTGGGANSVFWGAGDITGVTSESSGLGTPFSLMNPFVAAGTLLWAAGVAG